MFASAWPKYIFVVFQISVVAALVVDFLVEAMGGTGGDMVTEGTTDEEGEEEVADTVIVMSSHQEVLL